MGCGGALGDAARGLFDGKALDDCPLPCLFRGPIAVCLIFVLLGCEGFMIDLSVLGDKMMLYDDMRWVWEWVLKKFWFQSTFVTDLREDSKKAFEMKQFSFEKLNYFAL